MKFLEHKNQDGCNQSNLAWLPENVVEIEKKSLRYIVNKICQSDHCRYPLLAIRILIHVITEVDTNGRVYISARQLAKSLDANYDTVTKCIKYLRGIGVLQLER